MEADRELLELAAKAAGVDLYWRGDRPFSPARGAWNPLTDDGDALRLAVKLYINIEEAIYDHLERNLGSYEDQYAAVRRAIVCAAAEVGLKRVTKETT